LQDPPNFSQSAIFGLKINHLATLLQREFGEKRGDQGDQIKRIFAYWATAYFGQIFENYRSSLNFWDAFSAVKN
jgi:hypothetical protein